MPVTLKKCSFNFFWVLLSLLLLPAKGASLAGLNPEQLAGKQVAVMVYAKNAAARPYLQSALARMEGILADNAVVVLDQKKRDALQDVFKTLDDPGAFVTAEDFVENAEKFQLAALVAVYLHLEITPGLADYFSAGAHADIRFISETDARVNSLSLLPMGAPGQPLSDGLTRNSAAVNAIQRAIDKGCGELGFELMDPATPRLVRLDLKGPAKDPASVEFAPAPSENSDGIQDHARLEKATWRAEEVTHTAMAPAGALGAVAGYLIDTDFRRRPQRLYGSRIHLIDTRLKREIQILDCFAVEKKEVGETADRRILNCRFLSNWRYLAAVSAGKLFFWDIERGVLLTDPRLPRTVKSARLDFARGKASNYLVVATDKENIAYQIVRKSQ